MGGLDLVPFAIAGTLITIMHQIRNGFVMGAQANVSHRKPITKQQFPGDTQGSLKLRLKTAFTTKQSSGHCPTLHIESTPEACFQQIPHNPTDFVSNLTRIRIGGRCCTVQTVQAQHDCNV